MFVDVSNQAHHSFLKTKRDSQGHQSNILTRLSPFLNRLRAVAAAANVEQNFGDERIDCMELKSVIFKKQPALVHFKRNKSF